MSLLLLSSLAATACGRARRPRSSWIYESADAARTWSKVGDAAGRPAALASHRSELYVALHTSEVKMSTDGGRTWRTRVAP